MLATAAPVDAPDNIDARYPIDVLPAPGSMWLAAYPAAMPAARPAKDFASLPIEADDLSDSSATFFAERASLPIDFAALSAPSGGTAPPPGDPPVSDSCWILRFAFVVSASTSTVSFFAIVYLLNFGQGEDGHVAAFVPLRLPPQEADRGERDGPHDFLEAPVVGRGCPVCERGNPAVVAALLAFFGSSSGMTSNAAFIWR